MNIPADLFWHADCCLLLFSGGIQPGNPGLLSAMEASSRLCPSTSNVHPMILNMVTLGIKISTGKFQENWTCHAKISSP